MCFSACAQLQEKHPGSEYVPTPYSGGCKTLKWLEHCY